MKLGTRLNQALVRALLLQEGATVDFQKDQISVGSGGHGTHKERGKAPTGTSRPLVVQWAERFERLIEAFEEELDDIERGATPRPWGGNKAHPLGQRIREYDGYDPVYVAFVERCSVETVRRIRRDKGLDVSNGTPLERSQRPLTFIPRNTPTPETA